MKIALLGTGTMGRALLGGLLEAQLCSAGDVRATVKRAERVERLRDDFRGEPFDGVDLSTDNLHAARDAELILLCVKPRDVKRIAGEIAPILTPQQCVVSIAAGVRIEDIGEALAPGQPIVRAMPNTPCLVRQGMTVLSASPEVHATSLESLQRLFGALGRVLVLDEEHLDAVTGLSASGPAFVYVILEALAEGGVLTGLPRQVATELAAQTVLGASRMVLETGQHPAALKDAVTTPAGCTISALLTLEDGKIRSTLVRAVKEAARSAAELRTRG